MVVSFLLDGGAIHGAIKIEDGTQIENAIEQASTAAASLANGIAASQRAVLQDIVERIDLHDDHVDIALDLSSLAPEAQPIHHLSFPVQRMRRGQVVKLILPGSEPDTTRRDSRLIGLITEAHALQKTVLAQTGSLA